MSPERIYKLFTIKCRGLKDDVRTFKSHGSNSIVLFMNDYDRPLLFTVTDFNKGYWILEPYGILI